MAQETTPTRRREGGEVVVAYSGVHSIYHIAHAASEAGLLDRFYCSLSDSPGKVGRLLSRALGEGALLNHRRDEIEPRRVREHPWPLLGGMAASKVSRIGRGHGTDWRRINERFDSWVARRIRSSSSRIFVGAETCALRSFQAARRRGMKLVLDCPQIHPAFLERVLRESAEGLGLPAPAPVDVPAMARRKEREFALADVMLMLSEFQKQTFVAQGFDAQAMPVTCFWPDVGFLAPPPRQQEQAPDGGKLRALFVGSVSLRKGVPYLLRAMKECQSEVELSIVGTRSPEAEIVTSGYTDFFRYVAPVPKLALRDIYWRADVLVLPSVAEAYGWVAMEAMACGTPVIVSENCGAPVPDESWRVPVMDAPAIAQRLLLYARDRDLCREDGRRGALFAREWTLDRYRAQVAGVLRGLLS